MIKKLSEENFSEFINSKEKVVVDFFADWCGPCKAMLPLLERAENEVPGRVAKVDVQEYPDLAAKFGIRSIPTMITFKESMLVDKKVGAPKNTEEILQMLK